MQRVVVVGRGAAARPPSRTRSRGGPVAAERWIVDGDFFGGAGPAVFARADTVAFVDAPRITCVRRVLARRVLDWGADRPDLPAPEAFDWGLLTYIWRGTTWSASSCSP